MSPTGPFGAPRPFGVGPLVHTQTVDDLKDDIVVDADVKPNGDVDLEIELYGEAERRFTELQEKFGLTKGEMVDEALETTEQQAGPRGDSIEEIVTTALARYLAE